MDSKCRQSAVLIFAPARLLTHTDNDNLAVKKDRNPPWRAQHELPNLVRKLGGANVRDKSKKVKFWKWMWDKQHCRVGVNRTHSGETIFVNLLIKNLLLRWNFPCGKEHIKGNVHNLQKRSTENHFNSISLFSGKCSALIKCPRKKLQWGYFWRFDSRMWRDFIVAIHYSVVLLHGAWNMSAVQMI